MNNDFLAVKERLCCATVQTDELAVKQKLAETGRRLDLKGNERIDVGKVHENKSNIAQNLNSYSRLYRNSVSNPFAPPLLRITCRLWYRAREWLLTDRTS